MRILFVHKSFPTQYLHLAPYLAAMPGNEVLALRDKTFSYVPLPLIKQLTYEPPVTLNCPELHLDERTSLDASRRGARVATSVEGILRSGFRPDLICAHLCWGEAMFLKDLVPTAKLLLYCEVLRVPSGGDLDFDAEFSMMPAPHYWTRVVNAPLLSCLDVSDWGVTATKWQRQQFSSAYRPRISVIHDGIDASVAAPNPDAVFRHGNLEFRRADEVITFASRSLEPHRGFHSFMRSIPEIQKRRPKARIVIVGAEDRTYSPPLRSGESFKSYLLRELAGRIDLARVHFCDRVSREDHLALLQMSSVHIYLTYPYVLSWSLIEAMSVGCLIVGSRTPPVEEVIVDRENGLLVDFFSPQEIADRVVEALERKAEMQEIRDAARATAVAHYEKGVCLPEHVRLIESLVQGRNIEQLAAIRS